MTEEEGKPVERKEEKIEPLKKGALRDDLWEDLAIRHSVSKAGGDEDSSCRVYPEYDEKTGKAKFISSGKPEVLETFDKGLRAKQIEHEKLEVEKYPGDEGFPTEKAREIAAPSFLRTFKAIREKTPLPKPLWEDNVVKAEDWFLGSPKLEAPKGEKPVEGEEEIKKTFEGFEPHFDQESKE